MSEKDEHQGTLPQEPRLPRAEREEAESAAVAPPSQVPPQPSAGKLDDREDELEPTLRRVREGDQDAFRELVEATQDKVYGLVHRSLRCDAETTRDVCQEVYLRVFRGIAGFDGRSLFSTWLHKITMNVVISEIRHRRAMKRDRPTLSIDAPVGGQDDLRIDPASGEREPIERAEHKEFAVAVRAAVEELPDEFRDCVLLRDMQGLAYEQIAEVLNLAAGTVRSRIHRGRSLLQRKLKDYL